ncbi:response regulator transcription factor [Caldibacillus thermoamylovorans]|uniref:response regulator transcription factor n=1 Tax=Caldibacillus thermoamylovorans TaxID=35841 RepID=UPI00203EA346|nr:response regulator transcription factor [Caldibacillus thermoamylovorans]MCM3798910.1 response regulator transcription factor [Caldibacillus thermoamylovorans]
MTKRSILVVEDEEKIARVLQLELEYEGYNVEKAFDGNDALEKYRSQKWDLILLDVMLPGMSGIELLRKIRNNDPLTPVILLTARGSVADKVSGLDLGANDYVTKPFEMEELLARIRANLRLSLIQNETGESDWIKIGDLKVNEKSREVIRGNHTIELTPREFDLLLYLMKNRGQVLQREQILDAVWGYDFYGDTNVVDVYIRYLRRKIDADQQLPVIHTVRGVGYMVKEAK